MAASEAFASRIVDWLFSRLASESTNGQSTWQQRLNTEKDLHALAATGALRDLAVAVAHHAHQCGVEIPPHRQGELFSGF